MDCRSMVLFAKKHGISMTVCPECHTGKAPSYDLSLTASGIQPSSAVGGFGRVAWGEGWFIAAEYGDGFPLRSRESQSWVSN